MQTFDDMKKFLVKTAVFALIITVIDVLAGQLFDYLNAHAKGGNNGKTNYIVNWSNEDILIFGSSRAYEHYNPQIIHDSLDMTCYNCGMLGSGIIENYGFYQSVCSRYSPKLVIYDVYPRFDILKGEDNHKYLGDLRPYYEKDRVKEIFESVDPNEKYKMLSQMYRYNTDFMEMVVNAVRPIHGDKNGFAPIDEEMDMMKIHKSWGNEPMVVDSLKIHYLHKFLDNTNATQLVVVVSPTWYGLDTLMLQPIKDICKNNGILYWDYSNDPKYLHKNQYFADGSHLNLRGANSFTSELSKRLKIAINPVLIGKKR